MLTVIQPITAAMVRSAVTWLPVNMPIRSLSAARAKSVTRRPEPYSSTNAAMKNPSKRADCLELLAHPLMTRVYPDQDELADDYFYLLTDYMNTPKFK